MPGLSCYDVGTHEQACVGGTLNPTRNLMTTRQHYSTFHIEEPSVSVAYYVINTSRINPNPPPPDGESVQTLIPIYPPPEISIRFDTSGSESSNMSDNKALYVPRINP